ncbi:MAG: bifunctional oligoribonuclease/PAP phosphatase NrnA [Candidatus Saccharimonadales bacterium]
MKPEFEQLITAAHRIVIIQADNPDGDSLATALALEQILGDLGKEPLLYCGAEMPTYLHYLAGWDRVVADLPPSFDLSIIVDTSAISLLESLDRKKQMGWLRTKPCIVIDHHSNDNTIDFATLVINQPAVATGEILYELVTQYHWAHNHTANEMMVTSILSDSLGLTSEGTSARSIRIISELVECGVSIAALENRRRETMRKTPELVRYKGELLQRVEYYSEDRIAMVTIPWKEIEQYSHAYNPTMLVLDDMRLTERTDVAIGFKLYADGKITAKIRCNYGKTIADTLAEHFGGGGHRYASGFKIQDGRSLDTIKQECVTVATDLLDQLDQKQSITASK